MPEEALEDMIADIGNEEPNRALPGGMPGQQFADTSDEEDENINDGAPARVPTPAPERGLADDENEESGEDSDDEDIVVSSSTTLGHRHDFDCFYVSRCQYA